jgi:hypothetical protein
LGSANWSNNGLGTSGTEGLCVHIDDSAALEELNTVFCTLQKTASKQYPTASARQARLDELRQETQRNPRYALQFKRKKNEFSKAQIRPEDFYVCY